jgi:solute carrier family 30 (zinc transporter), member 5/7
MASSYALPASAMTHSHHGHAHSHSHSPARPSANTPRSMRQELSTSSLHTHSVSDSNLGHIHEQSYIVREHSPLRNPYSPDKHLHDQTHNHGPKRKPSLSLHMPSPHFKLVDSGSPDVSDPYGMTDDFPIDPPKYQPPVNEHHHSHATTASVAPKSQFTNFILPLVVRWPLMHTIMADRDSRRIFYFMR